LAGSRTVGLGIRGWGHFRLSPRLLLGPNQTVIPKLNDGTHLWGHVDFFTVGRPLEDRELSLKGPKLAIEEAEGEQEIEDYYSRVNVRALDIALMKVAYEKKAEKKGVRAGEGHAEGRKHGG
jgi:hypothetical protein